MLYAWICVLAVFWTCFVPSQQINFHTDQPRTTLIADSRKEWPDSTDRHTNKNVEKVSGGEVTIEYDPKTLEDSLKQGCSLIRLRRYLGNKARNCTTLKPVKFAFCGGICLSKFAMTQLSVPSMEKILKTSQFQYQCAAEQYHYKKIKVFCQDDGSVSDYRIQVVTSCKCKDSATLHNTIGTPREKLRRGKDED